MQDIEGKFMALLADERQTLSEHYDAHEHAFMRVKSRLGRMQAALHDMRRHMPCAAIDKPPFEALIGAGSEQLDAKEVVLFVRFQSGLEIRAYPHADTEQWRLTWNEKISGTAPFVRMPPSRQVPVFSGMVVGADDVIEAFAQILARYEASAELLRKRAASIVDYLEDLRSRFRWGKDRYPNDDAVTHDLRITSALRWVRSTPDGAPGLTLHVEIEVLRAVFEHWGRIIVSPQGFVLTDWPGMHDGWFLVASHPMEMINHLKEEFRRCSPIYQVNH